MLNIRTVVSFIRGFTPASINIFLNYDHGCSSKKEHDYFSRNTGKPYDAKKMKEKAGTLDTDEFESDIDADPITFFKSYSEYWLIEQCFRYYKNFMDIDDTDVNNEYCICGSEFINFILSSVMGMMSLINWFENL